MTKQASTVAIAPRARESSALSASRPINAAIAPAAATAAFLYAAAGILAHLSFHSFGWDLGVFDQVTWNLAGGRGFEYSFRPMSYLGDHFQPVLVLLAPVVWLGLGPSPLLAVQGLALGAAAVPLHAATRRLAGGLAAWGLSAAYLSSLAVARAVAFDFHPEAFAPLLAFTAFWGLSVDRPGVFAAATLALLPLKEDIALLAVALCWTAWLGFGRRRLAASLATASLAYMAVVTLVVMPHFAGGNTSPLLERYPYLGDSGGEIIRNAFLRPDLLAERLVRPDPVLATLLLLAGTAFLPLLRPRLLPPLAVLLAVPLLSVTGYQHALKLHYALVPYTYAFVISALALERGRLESLAARLPWDRLRAGPAVRAPAALALAAGVLYVALSPLPPSFNSDPGRFMVDHHSSIARSFVGEVPEEAAVSAQASFVPHLSRRHTIYEFPRIDNATVLLLDDKRELPEYDVPESARCRAALPSLGFRLERSRDGIELWSRSAEAAAAHGGLDCG